MIKYTFDQGSEAWHEIRAGKITGTRFKVLLSGHSTKGYKDLITDLACEIITGKKEESYSNAIMDRGTDMEPKARADYESIFDVKVSQYGFIETDEGTEFYGWIGVSPDGMVVKNLTEFKCPLMKTHLNYIKADKIPSEYKYQLQGQLYVTGADYVDFMSYYPGMKSYILRVYPDQEVFDRFTEELRNIIPLVQQEIEIYKNYQIF